MRFPALQVVGRQGFGKVAGAVPEHQLGQPVVVKPDPSVRQLCRGQSPQLVQAFAVGVVDETTIKVLIHVRRIQPGPHKHFGPDGTHVRQRRGFFGIGQRHFEVNAPLARQLGAERLQLAHHHRRLVQVDRFERQALNALGQIGGLAEQAKAQCGHVQQRQLAGVVGQVPGQQLVFVAGVRRQRPHHGQATPLGAEHAGHMQKRPGRLGCGRQTQFGRHAVFSVQAQAKLKQLGLPGADQPGQGNGGAHV